MRPEAAATSGFVAGNEADPRVPVSTLP